jgi:hypothetical protein
MTEIAGVTKPSSLRAVFQSLLGVGGRALPADVDRASEIIREFARLGPRWRILDDIAADCGDRPHHLVIGPGGVFAVTARHEARDTICLGGQSLLVDGDRVHHGRIGSVDAAVISARLSESVGFPVSVTALVLIVGDRRFVVPRQPDDAAVRLATPAGGVRWMRRRRVELSPSAADLIYAAACAPATWGAAHRRV